MEGTFTSQGLKVVTKGVTADGLVYGWGIVCTIAGEKYRDLQTHHIPDAAMLKATTQFMLTERTSKDMHHGSQQGVVVHSWPLTAEMAKAYGVTTEQTGWMVAVKFFDDKITNLFRTGKRKGFSIGGELTSYTPAIKSADMPVMPVMPVTPAAEDKPCVGKDCPGCATCKKKPEMPC